MNTADWISDLAAAAEELGYGIEAIDQERVTLEPRRFGQRLGPTIRDEMAPPRIIVEGRHLTGDILRAILCPFWDTPKP